MTAAKMALVALVAVVAVVAKPSAFAPPSSSSKARRRRHAAFVVVGGAGARRWTPEAALSTTTDDEFDPFLRSPLSFGSSSSSSAAAAVSENDDGDLAARRTNFGFLTYAECNVGRGSAAAAEAAEILASSEFDPLLSPHVYVNGVDAGLRPPSSSSSSSSSGVAAPATTTTPRRRKVGILLIDHGSKRSASNEHIHAVARMYERTLKEREDVVGGGGAGATTVVRAAHMEISAPSILDALRDVLVADGVAEVVCVPYFLSPGRHATEDVPNLIAEARDVLGREGLLSRARSADAGSADDDDDDDEIPILVSDALGTHLEGMLDAVDNLVERTLNK